MSTAPNWYTTQVEEGSEATRWLPAVTNALNLDPETVATIRAQIAAEPSVTGKRYNP